jgi:predicted PurR-regulated permease PerM
MMRRARQDGANDAFFGSMAPATFRDFVPAIGMITVLAGSGIYLILNNGTGLFAWLAIGFTASLAIYQFRVTAIFWERSLSDDWIKTSN